VDAIITDLPYGTTQLQWDTVIPFVPMWAQAKRVLKPRGVFVTASSQPFTSRLIMSNFDWFRYCLVWEKSISAGYLDANHKPLKAHEDIVIFCAAGRTTYNPQMETGTPYHKLKQANRSAHYRNMNGGVTENSGTRFPRSVVRFSNKNNFNVHPTQKPVELYEYLIRTYTNNGDTVLDITAGSGTTGVACVKTGRNFVGCEIDAGYFAMAERRLEDAQAQMQLFAPGEPALEEQPGGTR